MPKNRNYTNLTRSRLWGAAAQRCSFLGCRKELIEEETEYDDAAIIGEIAHIVDLNAKTARNDLEYPEEMLNDYDNLILLCRTHHTIVDKQSNTYTVEDLRKWKTEHEEWVRNTLASGMPTITSAELEEVCNSILQTPVGNGKLSTVSALIEPNAKMIKNNLTENILQIIQLGTAKSVEVSEFISEKTMLDSQYLDRLLVIFVDEYKHLCVKGLSGDVLFYALQKFASGGSSNWPRIQAGIAVLVYFFERCDIFES